MESISERLIYLRNAHNLTRKEVSEALGLLKNTYDRYEIGKRLPDNEQLLKIAQFYQVSPAFVLGFGDLQEEAEYYKEILEYISKHGDPDGTYAKVALSEWSKNETQQIITVYSFKHRQQENNVL